MTGPEFVYGSVVRGENLWIPRPVHPRISVIGLATDYWILGRDRYIKVTLVIKKLYTIKYVITLVDSGADLNCI
ncbi:hypothetical protein GIB67_029532, partial [Kingdonia uniflora]